MVSWSTVNHDGPRSVVHGGNGCPPSALMGADRDAQRSAEAVSRI